MLQMPDGITHYNKDVLFKVLSRNYENKSLAAYGLDLPRIKRLLPGNYPSVTATETRADNPFLLEDGTLLILEYESTVSPDDFLKYAGYVAGSLKQLKREGVSVTKAVIAVIYTGDITSAPSGLDLGALRVRVEQVFLSGFDTEGMLADLRAKTEAGEPLDDDDVLRLIILPLTQPDKERKQELIENSISIARSMRDEGRQLFAVAGIMTATDKFIDPEYRKRLKEWIRMTAIARLFEEEKIEAVNEAVNVAVSQNDKSVRREIARKMLLEGDDIIKVMQVTGLVRAEIDEILMPEVA